MYILVAVGGPNRVPKTAKILKDDEIAQLVYRDVQWAEKFRRSYEDKWKRFYKLYKNYINKATYFADSNLAIPTCFTTIEVQTAFLTDMIFEGGDFLEVLGKTPEGQMSARSVKDMLSYHFRHSFNIYSDMEQFARQLLMYGTSIYKAYWLYQPGWMTRQQPKLDPETGEVIGTESVLSAEVLANKPSGYTVDLNSFGVDPNATSILDARFAYEKQYVDPIVLREREQLGVFKNVDKVLGPAGNVNAAVRDRLELLEIEAHQDSEDVERSKVHVIDWWGQLTTGWEGGKLKKQAKRQLYHVMLALSDSSHTGEGNPVVLLAEPSPFHHGKMPFIDARINACVGEFYGTGDIEYCECLFVEERDIRNIQLDNMKRTMNQMWKVHNDAEIDEGELNWRPSGAVHVDQMDHLEPIVPPRLDPAVFNSQEVLRRDIEQVTGVNDFVMGQYRSSTGFNDTATGISLIQQVALKRIGHKGQIIQRMIRDLGQMTFALIAQYQPWGTSVRILDREAATQYRFIDISSNALRQEYDFHIVSAPSLGSKPLRQNQLIQLLQIMVQAKQDPESNFDFDMSRYIRRIIEEMDIPNSLEFVGTEQFQESLSPDLGAPAGQDALIPPEEENRLMVEQRVTIMPKAEENHPAHRVVHQEAYDSLEASHPARQLLLQHDRAHARLAEQTKDLMAQALSSQMVSEGVQSAQNRLNLLEGGDTKSPTGAGGQEDIVRALGNLTAGNA